MGRILDGFLYFFVNVSTMLYGNPCNPPSFSDPDTG